MFKVMKEKCTECLFTKDRIVRPGRMKELVQSCRQDDTFFECHKGTLAGEPVCCKGFWDTQDFTSKQLVERLGALFGTSYVQWVTQEELNEQREANLRIARHGSEEAPVRVEDEEGEAG